MVARSCRVTNGLQALLHFEFKTLPGPVLKRWRIDSSRVPEYECATLARELDARIQH